MLEGRPAGPGPGDQCRSHYSLRGQRVQHREGRRWIRVQQKRSAKGIRCCGEFLFFKKNDSDSKTQHRRIVVLASHTFIAKFIEDFYFYIPPCILHGIGTRKSKEKYCNYHENACCCVTESHKVIYGNVGWIFLFLYT